MLNNNILIIILLFLFNICIIGYIKFANKYKIISIPKNRDSHVEIKPKGAGIIFFFILLIVIINNLSNFEINNFFFITLCSIPIITIFSFFDDIYDLSWKYKITIDLSTSILIIYLFYDNLKNLDYFESYIYVLIPILILSISWFINLINFTDGSDGYLVSFTILNIAANLLIKLYFENNINYFNLCLLFISLNFLYYNYYKSSIFLGDCGSRLIAVILIINIIYDFIYYDLYIFLIWILSLLMIILDTGITLLQRIFINKKVLQEHKDHSYQILTNKLSHKSSLIWMILNYLFFVMPGIFLYINNVFNFIYVFIILSLLFIYQIIYIKLKFK